VVLHGELAGERLRRADDGDVAGGEHLIATLAGRLPFLLSHVERALALRRLRLLLAEGEAAELLLHH
jgi:hypothetical protein